MTASSTPRLTIRTDRPFHPKLLRSKRRSVFQLLELRHPLRLVRQERLLHRRDDIRTERLADGIQRGRRHRAVLAVALAIHVLVDRGAAVRAEDDGRRHAQDVGTLVQFGLVFARREVEFLRRHHHVHCEGGGVDFLAGGAVADDLLSRGRTDQSVFVRYLGAWTNCEDLQIDRSIITLCVGSWSNSYLTVLHQQLPVTCMAVESVSMAMS